MLYGTSAFLLVLWLWGVAASQTSGGAIHSLVVIAFILFLIRYVEKRV